MYLNLILAFQPEAQETNSWLTVTSWHDLVYPSDLCATGLEIQ
jgi:hypothetical protein